MVAGGGSLLGDAAGSEDGDRAWRPPSRHGSMAFAPEREQMGGVDILYLKNVVLKFLDAQAAGRTDQVGRGLRVRLHVHVCVAGFGGGCSVGGG